MTAGFDRVRANIESLTAYTARHAELRAAHHFLYDLRVPVYGTAKYVVMGINPGETKSDWEASPSPTEETSRYDFHRELGKGRSAIRWSKAANFFLDGADYVLAEIFFWSSADSRQFRERFGPIETSRHLAICTAMNIDLIEAHQPAAVTLPGLGTAPLVQRLYGLTHVKSVRTAQYRVAEHYSDGLRPWVFTKHWTASFGFSKTQKNDALQAIRGSANARSGD